MKIDPSILLKLYNQVEHLATMTKTYDNAGEPYPIPKMLADDMVNSVSLIMASFPSDESNYLLKNWGIVFSELNALNRPQEKTTISSVKLIKTIHLLTAITWDSYSDEPADEQRKNRLIIIQPIAQLAASVSPDLPTITDLNELAHHLYMDLIK